MLRRRKPYLSLFASNKREWWKQTRIFCCSTKKVEEIFLCLLFLLCNRVCNLGWKDNNNFLFYHNGVDLQTKTWHRSRIKTSYIGSRNLWQILKVTDHRKTTSNRNEPFLEKIYKSTSFAKSTDRKKVLSDKSTRACHGKPITGLYLLWSWLLSELS
jgi:hypothetical protein